MNGNDVAVYATSSYSLQFAQNSCAAMGYCKCVLSDGGHYYLKSVCSITGLYSNLVAYFPKYTTSLSGFDFSGNDIASPLSVSKTNYEYECRQYCYNTVGCIGGVVTIGLLDINQNPWCYLKNFLIANTNSALILYI
jgi:hypothetical protein